MNERLLRIYIRKLCEASKESRESVASYSDDSVKWNYPTDPNSLLQGQVFFQHKDNPNLMFKGSYEIVTAPYWDEHDPRWSKEYRYNIIDLKGIVREEDVTEESSEYAWKVIRGSENDERRDARTSRRSMKEKWNDLADHAFWNSDKIIKVHAINYAKKEVGALQKYFTEYNSPIRKNKDELSCLGFFEKSIDSIANYVTRKSPLMFTCKGYVTWAAATDSYTNELNQIKPFQKQHWKHSGIPKQPAGKRNISGRKYIDPKMIPFDSEDILLDEEDVKSFVTKPYISELIVANWILDVVYVSSTHPELKDIQSFCSEQGISLEVV